MQTYIWNLRHTSLVQRTSFKHSFDCSLVDNAAPKRIKVMLRVVSVQLFVHQTSWPRNLSYDKPKDLKPPFVPVMEALFDATRPRLLYRYGIHRVSVGRRSTGRENQDHLFLLVEYGNAAQNRDASDVGRSPWC